MYLWALIMLSDTSKSKWPCYWFIIFVSIDNTFWPNYSNMDSYKFIIFVNIDNTESGKASWPVISLCICECKLKYFLTSIDALQDSNFVLMCHPLLEGRNELVINIKRDMLSKVSVLVCLECYAKKINIFLLNLRPISWLYYLLTCSLKWVVIIKV